MKHLRLCDDEKFDDFIEALIACGQRDVANTLHYTVYGKEIE